MISLYRKGSTHTIRGVECELGQFPASKLQQRLSEGWLTCPTKIDKPVTAVIEESKPTTPNQKLRAEAKALGIETWETARITNLKELMGDAEG